MLSHEFCIVRQVSISDCSILLQDGDADLRHKSHDALEFGQGLWPPIHHDHACLDSIEGFVGQHRQQACLACVNDTHSSAAWQFAYVPAILHSLE